MFGIGMPELVVIFLIALVILGPKKLPEMGKAIGRGIREFRKSMQAMDHEITSDETKVDISSNPKEKIEDLPG